jgi:hypothetical protein
MLAARSMGALREEQLFHIAALRNYFLASAVCFSATKALKDFPALLYC